MNSQSVSRFANIVSGPGADAWEIHRHASERISAGDDIVLLTIGEDVSAQTPPQIVEQAVASLRGGRHHYPSVTGVTCLREAIAARHRDQTQREVTADNVVVFAGAQNALFASALCLLNPGDEVIVVEPYYSTYPATFSAMGSRFVVVEADPNQGLVPGVEQVRAAMTSATRLVVINSPNNPTGAVYPASFLEELLMLCREKNCWLLSDEVYADFVYDGVHRSVAEYAAIDDQLVVVSSLSKSHRMAGWRIGWAIAPQRLCEHLGDLNLSMTYGLPPFIQDAARFAIEQCGEVPREMAADYATRAQRTTAQLAQIERIGFIPPKAGMFVLLDVTQTKLSGYAFAERLLEQTGVAILPCGSFGSNLDNYLRMSLCADTAGLDRACRAIAEVAAVVRRP